MVNRRVAGVIAALPVAPTQRARQNLRREGVPEDRIAVTGNPVLDALQWVAAQPLDLDAVAGAGVLPERLLAPERADARLLLVTAHRRENFGRPLEEVCRALREVAARYAGGVEIVYPVHLNPNVREPVYRLLGGVPHVTLTPPLDYLLLVHLLKRAHLVLTDSGGIQEEAPGLGKPVLVLREVTERPEAVEAETVRLVGTDRARIVAETVRLLEDAAAYGEMARAVNPYGDGRAAARIVAALLGEAVPPFDPARPSPSQRPPSLSRTPGIRGNGRPHSQ